MHTVRGYIFPSLLGPSRCYSGFLGSFSFNFQWFLDSCHLMLPVVTVLHVRSHFYTISFFLFDSITALQDFFFPLKLSFSEISPAVSVSAFLEREPSGRSFTNRKHPMAAPSLWLWNLDTVLLLAVCTMRCVCPWPYWAKNTPSGLDEDQLANGRGMDVVKDKAKISKRAKKDEHF